MNFPKIEFTTRNVVTGIALTAALIAGITLIRRRTFGKKLSQYIMVKKLNPKGSGGGIERYEMVFSGKPYLDSIRQKTGNKQFIVLSDEAIAKHRKDLYDSMRFLGTDADKVKNVFFSFKDKVALAQVSESYLKHYKENLMTALLGEYKLRGVPMEQIAERLDKIPTHRLLN